MNIPQIVRGWTRNNWFCYALFLWFILAVLRGIVWIAVDLLHLVRWILEWRAS